MYGIICCVIEATDIFYISKSRRMRNLAKIGKLLADESILGTQKGQYITL
jgi:hypothetical protein